MAVAWPSKGECRTPVVASETVKAYIRRWVRLPALAGSLLVGLIASSACGTDQPALAPATSTPTATPSPTLDPRVDLAVEVAAAGLMPSELGVAGAKAEETVGSLAMPCDTPLVADSVAAHSWTFSGAKPAIVSNSVYAYYPEVGTGVVDQIRPALRACTTWIWAQTWDMAVVGEIPVTRPAGADNAVGYCHHGTIREGATKGNQVYLCDGVVSRGHLVSQVATVELTLAAAQADLAKALPLAGAALSRAVTTP
jgi:hypothetical protein